MDIEGTYTLQAASEDVRNRLTDAQTLRGTLPGAEQLESLDGKRYAVVLNIGHGPLAGRYTGNVTVIEQENPSHFHFIFEGEGRQSKIRSDWTIMLDGSEQLTIVAYEASVSLGKPAKSMSAPLIKGAIKLLIEEFFTSLAHQLPTIPTQAVVVEDDELFESDQPHATIVVPPPAAQRTFVQTIVRGLHLGGGDALAQERWVRRVRRFGITSILLFLVWIGTRLPRRLQRF